MIKVGLILYIAGLRPLISPNGGTLSSETEAQFAVEQFAISCISERRLWAGKCVVYF